MSGKEVIMANISFVTPWLGHPELIPAYEKAVTGAQAVIVDNASDAETAKALDAMVARLGNGSVVIHNDENRYFTAANNQGWQYATGGIVVFANNDIEATGPLLEQIARDVRVDDVLMGPSVARFDVDGTAYPYVEGWCVAAMRATWLKLQPRWNMRSPDDYDEWSNREGFHGPWDSINYRRCYGEDVDLSFRARLAGCSVAQTAWSIRHLSNHTSKTTPGAYDHAEANRETFRASVRRWRESIFSPSKVR